MSSQTPIDDLAWLAMGKHEKPKQDCNACHGTGQVEVGRNGKPIYANCVCCHGTGKV